MNGKKTVTVFGSAFPVLGEDEYDKAYYLGALLGANGFNVCTGGYRGIMEAVSQGVVENGGEAIGITLKYLNSPANKYLTKEIKCISLFERIENLLSHGDAYIILQGGTGTLLELSAVWEAINKKLMPQKPVLCHSQMWKKIGEIIDKQLEKEKKVSGIIKYYDTIEEMVAEVKKAFN